MNPLLWSLPARVPVKLFFAIRPDRDAGAAIQTLGTRLKIAHRLGGHPVARERLHNTLAAFSNAEGVSCAGLFNQADACLCGCSSRPMGFDGSTWTPWPPRTGR